ncbi:MAG: hypothetical protein J6M65_11110 [Eubacterium sp.]|nr:hypothetical protein [Eubacterium sp.]
MSKDDTVGYSFKLNLNNPDHLLIHQTLLNLNMNVYGNRSQFIINSLISYIKGVSNNSSNVSSSWYLTRDDMENIKKDITKEIKEEVLSETMKILFSAVSGDRNENNNIKT